MSFHKEPVIGILHPGQMGTAVGRTLRNGDHRVLWTSQGRSEASRQRASQAGFTDAGSLAQFCQQCSAIVSVCPPESAEAVAGQVLENSFQGLFVDANAIAPERARHIGEQMQAAGVEFVDGGIMGLPDAPNFLCLSGPQAGRVAQLFSAGPMTADVIGTEIGQASALKMCYAAHAKGTTALALASMAAAEAYGVWPDLKRYWTRNGHMARVESTVLLAGPKAWRFVGEMHEISATLSGAGVPEGFHESAAEMFERLRDLKDRKDLTLEEVLRKLTSAASRGT